MKIVAIGDIHGVDFADAVPFCDILLIAGDISPFKGDHGFYYQRGWFQDDFVVHHLPAYLEKAKHVVFVAGNHDTYLGESNISGNNGAVKKLLPKNVYYLCDELVEIKGVKIWGSPWVIAPKWAHIGPPVWNFAAGENQLKEIYSHIPNDIDIVLSHGPAFGFCDVIQDDIINAYNKEMWNSNPDRLGSQSFRQRLVNGVKAKFVISGHIHSADHNYQVLKESIDLPGIKFACASVLNEQYEPGDYKPLVINWK